MRLFLFLLSLLSLPVNAFDLGEALQKLQDPNVKKALDIGHKAAEANKDIDEPQEIQIGDGVASNLLGATPLMDNPELQRYVNRVGLWLALQTERPGLPWHFGITEDKDINAFTTPGGNVLITRGMWEHFRNESELAGVLAHEISHVLKKHHLKAIQNALGREWKTELIGAVAEANGSNSAKNMAKAFTAGTELYARGLDKADEFEADQMGMVIAARAGYNPYGLIGVLQTLDAVNAKDSSVALMFKTHPSPSKRLDNLQQSVGSQLDGFASQTENSANFSKMHGH